MYAVFVSGGKQYRAKTGDTVRVELLDHSLGDSANFNEVLLVGEGANVKVGQPTVASATVQAEIIAIEKGPKIVIYDKKRRKQYDKKRGHRQAYTQLLITAINDGAGGSASLSAAEKAKVLGNVGYRGDAWIEEVEAHADEAAVSAAPAKKTAAPKKAPAKKASAPKAKTAGGAKKTKK